MNRLTVVYWHHITGFLGFEVQIFFSHVSLPFGDASVQSLLVQLERIFSPDRLADDVRFDESSLYESQQQSDTENLSRLLSFRSRSLSLFIADELGGRLHEQTTSLFNIYSKSQKLYTTTHHTRTRQDLVETSVCMGFVIFDNQKYLYCINTVYNHGFLKRVTMSSLTCCMVWHL